MRKVFKGYLTPLRRRGSTRQVENSVLQPAAPSARGPAGPPGVDGPPGPPGEGVPPGGNTGQVLAKASPTDNDTEWVTVSGGGGGASGIFDGGHPDTIYTDGDANLDCGSVT